MESNNAEDKPESGVNTTLGSLFETVRTIVYAVLIAMVVRTLAYEPFNIPSGSMIPTLLVGDYLRSEEHTSELQSLMRISYAVFCLKKKTNIKTCNIKNTVHTYTTSR